MRPQKPSDFRVPFVIHTQPFCFWDVDIVTTNRRFIDRIDPHYFEFVGEVYSQLLKSAHLNEKQKQYAAVALRIAYSQALEVLFSLLFAALQAPACVVGWLSKYQLSHLRNIIDDIRNYRPMLTRFPNEFREWSDIVSVIFSGLGEAMEPNKVLLDGFTYLWANFAQDFTDEKFIDEYNSIKHGLRVHIGGFHLMMGLETEYGVPAKPENMETVSFSPFGSTFFRSERIDKTPNYIIHETSRNWNPENHLKALTLISVSIKNILVFLGNATGKVGPTMYLLPKDENFHHDPWRVGSGMAMGQKSQIATDAIPLMTADEIRDTYSN